jgi:hypothetical protein
LVVVDSTFFPPVNHFIFTTTEPLGYAPQFALGDFPVIEYWPGDANFDGKLDIADVVFLLNYIYIDGPPPPHPISADLNEPDRVIDVQDVVYLIAYLYQSGPNPLPGDPW